MSYLGGFFLIYHCKLAQLQKWGTFKFAHNQHSITPKSPVSHHNFNFPYGLDLKGLVIRISSLIDFNPIDGTYYMQDSTYNACS